MRNIYILDTSVLVYDPFCFRNFKNNDITIPIQVLDELDKLKTLSNKTGKNARVSIRNLESYCLTGDVNKGIKIEGNVLLKIDIYISKLDDKIADNKILSSAIESKNKNKKKKTILVSRDINLRIRARSYGVEAENYTNDKADVSELYTGFSNIKLQEGANLNNIDCKDLMPNECVYLESQDGSSSLARKIGNKIVPIKSRKPWGLDLRNKEQAFATDLIFDNKVPLVTLVGKAGVGKSLVAIACALDLVLDKKQFTKLIVYKSIHPVGKDIGFLPGTMKEKLMPWMQSIYDAFEFLFSSYKGDKWNSMLDLYVSKGIIQLEAITYIRGRSIPNALILLDESQNISKEEIKTVLTRLGPGSKIILTGDIEQIDNSDLDAINNGFSYVIEKFKDSDLAGHITFTKGERSPLATKAAEIL